MRALAVVVALGCGHASSDRPHAAPAERRAEIRDARVAEVATRAADATVDSAPAVSAACTRYSDAFIAFETCASTTDLPKGVWAKGVERNEDVYAHEDGPELDRACEDAYKKLVASAPACF